MVRKELESDDAPSPVEDIQQFKRIGNPVIAGNARSTVLEQDVPAVVDEKVFDYTYECKHCGHQWIEVHTKQDAGRVAPDYTGD